MRLRRNWREIGYNVGQVVRILNNLNEQETNNILNGGSRLRAGIGDNVMISLQGMFVRIAAVRPNGNYRIEEDRHNVYSADMFTNSYEEDPQEELNIEDRPTLQDLIYNGMYLFSRNSEENGTSQELFRIRISSTTIREGLIEGLYIRLNDKQHRNSDIALPLDTWVNNETTWMRYGRNWRSTAIIRQVDGRQFVSSDLYIPDNDILMERFGVSNRVTEVTTKKLEGHLDLPNIFEGYKYPVVYLTYSDSNYTIHKEYGFKISSKILVTYNGKSKVTKKISNVLGESKVTNNEKHLKNIILDYAKPTVKSYEKSVGLFGHKTRKKAMFESVDTISEGKTKKTVYKITSVKFNYDKEGTFYHVVELNDGTLNLKFLLEDIDLNLPTINDYVAPKDRTIKAQDECKLVNNKITPVQKNSTVKVIRMFNRHQVHNPKLGVYDKNTVALVIDKNTNKQFECKIKQLKKI